MGAEPACRTSPEVEKAGTAVDRERVERVPRFRKGAAPDAGRVGERVELEDSMEPREVEDWVCGVGRESSCAGKPALPWDWKPAI